MGNGEWVMGNRFSQFSITYYQFSIPHSHLCGINFNLNVVNNIISISGKKDEKNILDEISVCILGISAIC
ncbi:hypothetical protein NIES4075_61550 [Tolypothrix sp. NIES-4075]|nr:hypothetical protein NIES4075_61550 [Tolypothrix sp. NIES-4075]